MGKGGWGGENVCQLEQQEASISNIQAACYSQAKLQTLFLSKGRAHSKQPWKREAVLGLSTGAVAELKGLSHCLAQDATKLQSPLATASTPAPRE